MKPTKSTLLVLAGVLIAGALFSFKNNKSNEPEAMTIDILTDAIGINGIYIHHNNKEPEVIELSRGSSAKNIISNGKIISKTLDRLYKEGWKIESSAGIDVNQRIYLVKE